jgi:hypothetical protein
LLLQKRPDSSQAFERDDSNWADKIATDVIEAAGAHVELPLAPKAPWWRWWWGNQRWRRLASAVVAYDLVLRGRAQQDATLAAGLSAIRTALKSASDALETGDIDRGWKCFHNAQQIELLHLGDAQLCAAAMAIRSEADKLGGWRKAAVMKLLDRDCCETGLKAGVFQAARIRDEHYDNEAYKDGLRRRRSLCFASILGIVVAALLGLSWGKSLPSAGSLNETDMLLSMAMFGLLGAAISAAIAAAQPSSSSRIPEMVSSFGVTALRLVIGPASAVVLYFAAQSAMFSKIFSFGAETNALFLVAVAAGFSERLVLRVVETMTGKDSE